MDSKRVDSYGYALIRSHVT